jgi:hypothetical protein
MTPTHRTTRPVWLYDNTYLPVGTPVAVPRWRDDFPVLGWIDTGSNTWIDPSDLEPIPPREEQPQ